MADITAWSEENVSLTALANRQYQPTGAIDVIDRINVSAASAMTFGNISAGLLTVARFTFFTPTRNLTVNTIASASAGTGANYGTATGLECRMGLYTVQSDTTATLVARTDHDSTMWTIFNTLYSKPFSTTGGYPSSYALVAGQRYAAAMIIANTGGTMTTAPSISGIAGQGVLYSNTNLSPVISGSVTTTTLPTSPTIVQSGNAPWFRLSLV